MSNYIPFEDIEDQHVPTIDEEEEMYHYAQVQQAKSIFNHNLGKDDIPVIVNTMVESVLEKGNPLEIAEKVKVMELILEGFKSDKRYKDYAIEEAAKHKGGYVSPTGARIEVRNAGGGKPNFKVSNDPKVIDLEKQLKERQQYLLNLPSKGVDELDESTGEMRHLWPAAKSASTETIVVTLKK